MMREMRQANPQIWLLLLLTVWVLLAAPHVGQKTASGIFYGQETASGGLPLLEAAWRLGFSDLARESASVPLVAANTTGPLTQLQDVADYVSQNGKLPPNFIDKPTAQSLGWNPKAGNLDQVAPNKSIGGDVYQNRSGALPSAPGRTWYEGDLNYNGGYRGNERILYSNDGLIYHTNDHYKTFTLVK